jgi:ElaB/YqjD/DUF883 family membrane-anchored ribosome-binding protein
MTTKNDFERDLGDLGREIDEVVEDSRDTYHNEKQELKRRWNEFDAKRKRMANATEEAWDDVKDEFSETANDLRDTYDDLKRKING